MQCVLPQTMHTLQSANFNGSSLHTISLKKKCFKYFRNLVLLAVQLCISVQLQLQQHQFCVSMCTHSNITSLIHKHTRYCLSYETVHWHEVNFLRKIMSAKRPLHLYSQSTVFASCQCPEGSNLHSIQVPGMKMMMIRIISSYQNPQL